MSLTCDPTYLIHHLIYAGTDLENLEEIASFYIGTSPFTVLNATFDRYEAQYVKVITGEGGDWVAWQNISLFGDGCLPICPTNAICTNTSGSYECYCPPPFVGNSTVCSFCGNGTCDPDETCATCPSDCGFCGQIQIIPTNLLNVTATSFSTYYLDNSPQALIAGIRPWSSTTTGNGWIQFDLGARYFLTHMYLRTDQLYQENPTHTIVGGTDPDALATIGLYHAITENNQLLSFKFDHFEAQYVMVFINNTLDWVALSNVSLFGDGCMPKCPTNAICSNKTGSYECSCIPPLFGNSTFCTACSETTCFPGVECSTVGLNFSCGACPSGLSGSGIGPVGCSACNETTCFPGVECSTVGLNFSCGACPSGMSGSGIGPAGCSACNETTCFPGVQCSTVGLNFSCGACPSGFIGSGIGPTGCNKTNICSINNGNCDQHTECTSINGSRVCSACPLGFNGTGDGSCIAQCGNGMCEANLGEHCVSCPLDCHDLPCGQCGDGYCDPNASETCTTCSEDCQCKVSKCAEDCTKHGTCVDGICVCLGSLTGPACDQENTNVSLNITSNDPEFSIGASSSSVIFTIALKQIRELDVSNNPIITINLTNSNFTFYPYNKSQNGESSNSTQACNNCDLSFYISTIYGSPKTERYATSSILENGAYLEIMIWHFVEEAASVRFANTTTNFAANAIKLALQIRNWPFRAQKNTLALVLESVSNSNSRTAAPACVTKGADENDNLRWFTVYDNGTALYGQFLDKMIVDGLIRDVRFKLDDDGYVTAMIPHFWVNAVVDPSFSVLLGAPDKTCRKASKKDKKIVEIVTPVVVVLFVALLVLLLMTTRIRSYLVTKTTARKIRKERNREILDENLEFEKINSLEVNSAAGNFNLQL